MLTPMSRSERTVCVKLKAKPDVTCELLMGSMKHTSPYLNYYTCIFQELQIVLQTVVL